MKQFTFFLVAVATMAGLVALIAPAPGHAEGEPAPFVTEIPHGYRDWKWISSAHEAGNLNSLGAVLGNDVAFNAFRAGKLPYPDGSILAALHYKHVPVGGKQQSLWPGSIFRSRSAYEHSVYGQGLEEVRCDRRLGVRSLRGRQTWRRGVYEKLLPLPREDEGERPCLYSVCAVIWVAGKSNGRPASRAFRDAGTDTLLSSPDKSGGSSRDLDEIGTDDPF